MSLVADKSTLDRLALVKQLYNQALVQSTSRHHIASRVMSVITFDLAVETILKLIIDVLDPNNPPKNERNFPQYRSKADEVMQLNNIGQLPDQRRITRVHDIRNDAQHRAKYPDPTEVSDCRTYIRDFLQQLTVQVWNLPFDQISLADLVQHPRPKMFLVAAETALAKKDYDKASEMAAAAIKWTFDRAGYEMVGGSEFNKTFGEILIKQTGFSTNDLGQEMYRSFWKIQDTLRIISLGLNYADYVCYEEIVSDLGLFVAFPMRGDGYKTSHKRGVSILRDTAEYLVNYAMDTVLQIENLVGDLDSPFGRRHRYLDGRSEPRTYREL